LGREVLRQPVGDRRRGFQLAPNHFSAISGVGLVNTSRMNSPSGVVVSPQ